MVALSKRLRVRPRPGSSGGGPADTVGCSPLRLSVARGELGIELYQPQPLGPLQLVHLAMTLPGLKFPVDLSGGVPVFRHRRGRLESLELRGRLADLAAWVGPRTKEVIGRLERPLSLRAGLSGLQVGMVAGERALAFDLLWVPDGATMQWVIARARGVGLGGAALGYALRATDAAFSGVAERRGRIVRIRQAPTLICRAVLPQLGTRVPDCDIGGFSSWAVDGDQFVLRADARERAPVVQPEAVAALELAELVSDADDALASGRPDDARAGYLKALESAPRHPELSMLVAEIDLTEGDRVEAALGLLAESTLAVRAGRIGAKLLTAHGDFDGAAAAWADAARQEWFAPLAALLWLELHASVPDASAGAKALDQAVSCCPALAGVRWARVAWRIRRGDVSGAISDSQHFEASIRGASARYDACMRVASELLSFGFVGEARGFFERALRYLPGDVGATAGLARAYRDCGDSDRALALYERAVRLDELGEERDSRALVEFAELLAQVAKDLPQAIARVRSVPDGVPFGLRARHLEGRWRFQLGDIAGATLAFARMRECAELSAGAPLEAATWLIEAATFERDTHDDLPAAERHLSAAMRIAPRDASLLSLYRRTAASLAKRGT